MVAAAEQRRAEPSGRLRVSVPLDLLSQRELWLTFSLKYPRVALELEPTNRHVDLVAERFDLALRGGRGADDSLVARAVGGYHLVAVASPDYLARWGKLESPAALRQHSCLLFRELGHRPGHPDRPAPPHRHIICPDERFALEGARCGLGVAILRYDIAAADLQRGALCVALEAYNPLRVPLYAIYPDKTHLKAAVLAFIQHIEEQLGGSDAEAPLSAGG